MDRGWISLYRKLIDWEWYTDGNTCRLYIHLLLKANHDDKEWRGESIKRGQLITGRKHLSKELSLTERQIRTSLNKLEKTNDIAIKPTNQYSIITIVNYNKYQKNEKNKTSQKSTKKTDKRPTSDQQATTNNNYNNKNNNNKRNNPLPKNLKKIYESVKN